MRSKILLPLLFMSAALTHGCAFKESESERQASQSAAQNGALRRFKVAIPDNAEPIFDSGSAVISQATRYGLEWSPASPISLPVQVPEKLTFDLEWADAPLALQNMEVRATATSGEDLNEKDVSARVLEVLPSDSGVTTRLGIEGLHQLFRQDREQRLYLNLELKSASAPPKRIKVLLTTPPSRLTLVERLNILPETALDKGMEALRVLRSQAETRALLQVIRLRNDSFAPLRISAPMKSSATLHAPGIRHFVEVEPQPNPHLTRTVQREKPEDIDLPGQFFFYPLTERLPEIWTGLTQRELSLVMVNPGETVALGLYASGDTLSILGGIPTSRPTQVLLPTDARARCPADRMAPLPQASYDGGAWYCDLMTGGKGGWNFPSTAVEICRKTIPSVRKCFESGFADTATCTQAALLDDEVDRNRIPHPDNRIPWPIWMGCRRFELNAERRLTYIHVGWEWDPILSPFLVGLRTLPVVANWENKAITLQLRFDDRAAPIEAQARDMELVANGLRLRDLNR